MMEINKDELRKIAYNCRKATFLIEKQQTSKITLREQLELKVHLAGCSVCRIYEKQSRIINQMVKDLFSSLHGDELRMTEIFKKKLEAEIRKKLTNK